MRIDYVAIDKAFRAALGSVRLIAVKYLETAPEGVEAFSGTAPSGCTFWKLAASGRGFYTVPDDHLNCPIGSYTHAIDLPPERASELQQMLSLLSDIGYVRLEEVPSISRLPRTPAFTYYAPLAGTVVDPDVVIVAGRPSPLMRIREAALRAGAASKLPITGRPTCMALPAAVSNGCVLSSGCIGNRVYTGLGDDELYMMIPGGRLADVARELAVVSAANDSLEQFHRNRQATFSTGPWFRSGALR
jgi:uncharacterized protein (DUF169 family)